MGTLWSTTGTNFSQVTILKRVFLFESFDNLKRLRLVIDQATGMDQISRGYIELEVVQILTGSFIFSSLKP